MTLNENERDAANDGEEKANPEPSRTTQTPFERFEDFARQILSVPKAEIEERELTYQEARKRARERPKEED